MPFIRVHTTIRVPSGLEAELLVNNQQFLTLVGQAVQAVAAQAGGASVDPKWDDYGPGFKTTAHIHYGEQGCEFCKDKRSSWGDRIEE